MFIHNASIESFHIPYVNVGQNPDEACALLMQLVSQKALKKSHIYITISHIAFLTVPREQRAVI